MNKLLIKGFPSAKKYALMAIIRLNKKPLKNDV